MERRERPKTDRPHHTKKLRRARDAVSWHSPPYGPRPNKILPQAQNKKRQEKETGARPRAPRPSLISL